MTSPSSAADLTQMFDLAPVSLWLEDYSALRALLEGWRAEGVSDLRAWLSEDSSRVQRCASSIKVLQVNQQTLRLLAAARQDELTARLDEVFRGDMTDKFVDELCELWDGATGFSNQSVNYALDGRRIDVQVQARILPGHEKTWSRVLVSLEDITERVQAMCRVSEGERYARQLFDLSPVSLWVEDFSAIRQLMDDLRQRGISDFATFIKVHPEFVTRCMQEIRVIDVNQHTLRMFGAASKADLLGKLPSVFRDEMQESFADQLLDLWQGKLVQQREVLNYALSGEPIHIHLQFAVHQAHEARWDLVQVSLVDITARKKAEAYLEYLGKHDVLTGLRNRAFFNEELNRLSRKGPWPVSLLLLDLNGLKWLNDEQGHGAGDTMLRRAGEVLREAVDAPNVAARIGGDEFVVLLPGMDEHGATTTRERILSVLAMNNQFYPGQTLSLAIGAATCQAGQSLDLALQSADQRMYQDKERHYNEQTLDRRRTLPKSV